MRAGTITRLSALAAIAFATATLVQATAPTTQAGGGGCRGVPITEAAGDTVTMQEGCFEPSVLRVEPGQPVTFFNASTQPHNVAGQNTSWGDFEERLSGESVTHVFDEPGTYAYHCIFHAGMVGVVVVGDGKGTLTGAVSRVDDTEDSVLASVPQTTGSDLVAPSSDARAAAASGETDWLALAGVGVLGLVAGGSAVALARRR